MPEQGRNKGPCPKLGAHSMFLSPHSPACLLLPAVMEGARGEQEGARPVHDRLVEYGHAHAEVWSENYVSGLAAGPVGPLHSTKNSPNVLPSQAFLLRWALVTAHTQGTGAC